MRIGNRPVTPYPAPGWSQSRAALAFALSLVAVGMLSCGDTRASRLQEGVLSGAGRTFLLVEDMRIDGNVENLVAIGDVAPGPHGIVAFSQQQDLAVRFYNAAGDRVGSVGRAGSGPGEFRNVHPLGWVADTLWVYDAYLHRVTLVGPDLMVVRALNVPRAFVANGGAGSELSFVHPAAYLGTGTMLVRGDVRQEYEVLARLEVTGEAQIVGVLTPSYADLNTIVAPDGSRTVAEPFSTTPVYGVSPDGGLAAIVSMQMESQVLSVVMLNANGDTLVTEQHAFEGIPIPRSLSDSVVNVMVKRIRPHSPALARLYAERVKIPPYFPPAVRVIVGDDGTLWIEQWRSGQRRPYVVLDSSARMLGRLALPWSSRVVAANAQLVWIVQRDERGIESLLRYRIRPLDPGQR